MTFTYRAPVLGELARHGVRPTPGTDPDRVREFVNDLYRYELRRLRDRLLRREIPKPHYHDHVLALRARYRVLSLRRHEWLEDAPPVEAAPGSRAVS